MSGGAGGAEVSRRDASTPSSDSVPGRRAVRRLGYPFGKLGNRFREVRYALLDTCPDPRDASARPMISLGAGDGGRLMEFDVVRFFQDRVEAERYAAEHGVSDFKTDADDYRVLPQLRPVVAYLKALETSDFKLYRTAFDYDWKPRHLTSRDFWGGLRKQHAGRLKAMFGEDYSSAELDFGFVPYGEAGRSGRVDATHRGRRFDDFVRVIFVEASGEWKIDQLGG